jgi:uncharacterized membrane protein HdeD (DUF308 family)
MTALNPSVPLGAGIAELRRHWGWFLVLGIVLICLGMFALGATFAATLASVLVLAWILIIAGIANLADAFQTRSWKGVVWHVILGIVDLLVGVWLLLNPALGAIKVTFILAIFFVIEGVFQILAGISGRLPHRGWQIFSGLITLLLGVMVFSEWPYSGVWFLGMCLGIGLIFRGWSMIALSMIARRAPAPV